MGLDFVRPTKRGALLRLTVRPSSSADRVHGPYADRLKVAVSAAPERGKANKALIAFLAREIGISKSRLALVSGETSQEKELLLTGVRATALERRLKELGWT